MIRRALAHDEVTIDLAGRSVTLRPTLRAAMRIERRLGGFDRLFRDLEETKLSTFAIIIEETAVDPMAAAAFLAEIASKPIGVTLHDLQAPLIGLAIGLTGASIDDEVPTETPRRAPSRIDWAQNLQRLFEIGAGWLEWTPAETWNATPAEIMAAYAGQIEKFNTLNGAGPKPKDTRSNAERVREMFAGRTRKEAA